MTRPTVSSQGPVAVTPHDLGTRAAIQTMEAGGNAVDAAIAADAVLTVVAPETCGIGGDLFALIHRPGDASPLCLNSSGRAGSLASSAELREAGHQEMPLYHPAAITVPGCVDGWEALAKEAGSMPLAQLVVPAVEHATNGFAVSAELAATLTRRGDQLRTQPSAAPFYPDDAPAAEGDLIGRPRLADTLGAIGSDGRRAFYGGEFGAALCTATEGRVTPDDLAVRQVEWVEPLAKEVFDETAWTVPPNTQGYLTLATLRIFEMLGVAGDPDNPDYHHALIEAYRAASWDRDDLATDPSTAPLSAAELVDDDRLGERAATINMRVAGGWPSPRQVPGGTAYLCTIDGNGTGVSFIQSNFHGIGSGFSAGDTGVWLHNRGGGFTIRPGHPNELAPGRRPLHTLAPTLWTSGNRLSMLLGTRGGHLQPQLLAQVAAHLHHGQRGIDQAQSMPRWSIPDAETVEVEAGFAGRDELARRGHRIVERDRWMGSWGPVSVIRVDPDGNHHGGADPRVATTSARSRQ